MWKLYKNKGKMSKIKYYKIEENRLMIKVKGKIKDTIISLREDEIGKKHFDYLISFAKKGEGLQRYIEYYGLDIKEVSREN